MNDTRKRMVMALPAAMIALPLLFTAPASAADYTATASETCAIASGVNTYVCNSVSVNLPSDKTWVDVIIGGNTLSTYESGDTRIWFGGGFVAGTTVVYNFTLVDEDSNEYSFAVTVVYSKQKY